MFILSHDYFNIEFPFKCFLSIYALMLPLYAYASPSFYNLILLLDLYKNSFDITLSLTYLNSNE